LHFVANIYRKDISIQERIDHLLETFSLSEQKNKFIYALSNGMKRKVSHIAALMLESKFTILDEPFTALDPTSIYLLKDYIVNKVKESNQAFIISSHQLAILDSIELDGNFFEIIFLRNGKVIFEGNKMQLFALTGAKTLEEAYMNMQREKLPKASG
jgi:ABC-type multidrug transport system ATPase subunit